MFSATTFPHFCRPWVSRTKTLGPSGASTVDNAVLMLLLYQQTYLFVKLFAENLEFIPTFQQHNY